MQTNVTCRHMETTDAMRSYAQEKVEQDLAEFPRVQSVHIILDVEKYRHSAEIIVTASGHIQVEGRDISVSIDNAIDKAARQLRRHRDKIQDHKLRERLAEVEEEVKADVSS